MNSVSEDQESSVETIGRYAFEDPERNGTNRVWTPESESESSRTIGGEPEEISGTGGTQDAPDTATGKALDGPETGAAGTGGKPRASLT